MVGGVRHRADHDPWGTGPVASGHVSDEPVPHPDSPAWFRQALATPRDEGTVEVDGVAVHHLAWGEPGRRGLVFVHGGGAHAHWWTHVAARFAGEFRVVAVDLTGHGDSGHREVYDFEQWTREVLAAGEAGGIAGPPVVIGHSMGGFVAIATAALHGDRLAGVVVCDSPVTEPDPEVDAFRLKEEFGGTRTYPDLEAAVARFRTVPPQPHYLPYVMDHVARRSLRPADGGWTWKFDRRIFFQFAGTMRGVAYPYLERIDCRLALLRSEHGLVTADIGRSMFEAMGRVTPVLELPEAGHHAMLDQPLVLLTALRALLADWDHSQPHARPRSA
jgi:pimeloyl-ACP methyl ester carboxylesterase